MEQKTAFDGTVFILNQQGDPAPNGELENRNWHKIIDLCGSVGKNLKSEISATKEYLNAAIFQIREDMSSKIEELEKKNDCDDCPHFSVWNLIDWVDALFGDDVNGERKILIQNWSADLENPERFDTDGRFGNYTKALRITPPERELLGDAGIGAYGYDEELSVKPNDYCGRFSNHTEAVRITPPNIENTSNPGLDEWYMERFPINWSNQATARVA